MIAARDFGVGRPHTAAMIADDRVRCLQTIAAQLAGRVREDAPEDFQRWLRHAMDDAGLRDEDGWMGLAIVASCAVPVDRPFRHLVAWTWTGAA